ncbi:MAG: ABC transporter ATP-binding protein [Spirochaetia bacterium]|nr:ABC transporter ATP-binding protein [Spirochaetia bacterium]
MIDISSLSVLYQRKNLSVTALDNISIHIGRGEIYTFIGPSGCGKSTLLHVLSGIIREYSGTALIDGAPIDPKKQRIGLVLQNYGLLPWKTVLKNCLLGIKIKDRAASLDDYGDFITKELGINQLLDRYPGEISGGQKQRVAIARAFILRPDLLLMDEPFSALDAITREEMQELFLNIWKSNQVTTVFITHSVDEALYLGSKIVVFSKAPGRILDIIKNPCFMSEDVRNHKNYYEMARRLRDYLRQAG